MTSIKRSSNQAPRDRAPVDVPSQSEVEFYAKMAAEHSLDALLVTDDEDRVLWLNQRFEQMSGYSLQEMVGKNPDTILRGEGTGTGPMPDVQESLRLRRPCDIEVLYYRSDGTPFWMESRITPIFDAEGRHTHFMSSSRDITTRRELETTNRIATEHEAKRQREQRLLSQVSEWLYSAKSLDELLSVVNRSLGVLVPEAAGQLYVYSNSRDVLDLLTNWNGGKNTSHIDPDDCWSLRRGRAYSYGLKSIEFPCQHVDNRGLPYFCLPIVAHGQTNGLLHLEFKPDAMKDMNGEQRHEFMHQRWQLALLCAEQISLSMANVQLRQELLDQSVRDPLTNLWNRRWMLETAHKEIQNAERNSTSFAIMSLDVDNFKRVNDRYGPDAGDMLLREIGNTMIEFFAPDAAPCRMGGEEFLVLCPGLTAKEAAFLADQFRQKTSNISVNYTGARLPVVTTSIGVAAYPEDGKQLVDLLNMADRAMYKAKEAGKDRVIIHKAPRTPRRKTA